MSKQNTELHEKISKALNQKVLQMEAQTCSALSQAREQALLKAKKPAMFGLFEPPVFGGVGRFATASLSVLLVAGISLITFNWLDDRRLANDNNPAIAVEEKRGIVSDDNADPLQITTGIDLDALKEGEDLDLFENMDLYQWLDNEFGSA